MRGVAMVVLLLGACAEEPTFLDTAGLSALVLIEATDTTITAVAHAIEPGTAIRREAPSYGTLYALGYADTLDELGLPTGPLTVDPAGLPLPPTTSMHRLDARAWTTLATLPPDLEIARFASAARCTRFAVAEHQIETAPDVLPLAMVEVDRELALLSLSDGRYFTVGLGGPLPGALTSSLSASAAFAAESEVWLASFDGRTRHGALGRGFVEGPRIPVPPALGAVITGSPPGQPFELFATNYSMVVAHYDGQTWRVIRNGHADGDYKAPGAHVGLAWLGPGAVVMVGAGTSSITELSADGRAREVTLDGRADGDVAFATRRLADGRLLVVTRNGQVFERQGESWVAQPPPPIASRPEVMIDLGAGAVMMGGQDGVMLEWRADRRFCEPVVAGSGFDLMAGARIGRAFAAASIRGISGILVSVVTR